MDLLKIKSECEHYKVEASELSECIKDHERDLGEKSQSISEKELELIFVKDLLRNV